MRARRLTTIAAVIVALAGTVVAVATAPNNAQITAPFPVRGAVGDTLYSRQLVVRATGVRLARQLKSGYRDIGNTSTDGVWVVVDADITSRLQPVNLDYTTLSIDGVAYRVSGILPNPSILDLPYGAGVTSHGTLVFELPRAAVASAGAARASLGFATRFDMGLDTVPTVVVDLTTVDVEARAVIDEPYVVDAK